MATKHPDILQRTMQVLCPWGLRVILPAPELMERHIGGTEEAGCDLVPLSLDPELQGSPTSRVFSKRIVCMSFVRGSFPGSPRQGLRLMSVAPSSILGYRVHFMGMSSYLSNLSIHVSSSEWVTRK